MLLSRLVITAILTSAWALPVAAQEGSALRANAHTEIYCVAVERHLQAAQHRRQRMKYGGISTACYTWMLAERTRDARYQAFALQLYDRFLTKQVGHDFHFSRPFGLLT